MQKHWTYSVEEAISRMERYCAYRERCHKEVIQKLQQMRMIPAAIDQIVGHLIESGYLNETRFACAFARGKFRTKKWGKMRIRNELKARDISTYNIMEALKEIDASEYLSTFDSLCEKRLRQLEHETNLQKKKKKMADYLLYRGWETQMVYDCVNAIT